MMAIEEQRAPNDTAILLRTHYADPSVIGFARDLAAAAGLPVHILADQTGKVWKFPKDLRPVAITDEAIDRLGLLQIRNVLWRCGDYGLYVALEALPSVQTFWLIEHDVRFRISDLRAFFADPAWDGADLVTSLLQKGTRKWPWHRSMTQVIDQVWRCFFPVNRFSRKAVEILLSERRRLGALFTEDPALFSDTWPNDEAFVSSTLAAHGCRLLDFNRVRPGTYSPDLFVFHNGFHPAEVEALAPDAGFVHPVLDGPKLAAKLHRVFRFLPPAEIERKAALLLADGVEERHLDGLLKVEPRTPPPPPASGLPAAS